MIFDISGETALTLDDASTFMKESRWTSRTGCMPSSVNFKHYDGVDYFTEWDDDQIQLGSSQTFSSMTDAQKDFYVNSDFAKQLIIVRAVLARSDVFMLYSGCDEHKLLIEQCKTIGIETAKPVDAYNYLHSFYIDATELDYKDKMDDRFLKCLNT